LTPVCYKKREEKRLTGRERERERGGKCGLCAVCVVLELGFKRCFRPLFSIPRWPSFVMRNVDFRLTEEGRKKRENGSLRERERERERRRKMGTLRCLCDIKIRV
jgi:hypothetical protein